MPDVATWSQQRSEINMFAFRKWKESEQLKITAFEVPNPVWTTSTPLHFKENVNRKYRVDKSTITSHKLIMFVALVEEEAEPRERTNQIRSDSIAL